MMIKIGGGAGGTSNKVIDAYLNDYRGTSLLIVLQVII